MLMKGSMRKSEKRKKVKSIKKQKISGKIFMRCWPMFL
jgi:hypothetical protein